MRELTPREERAIEALRHLARTWPPTLKLFSWSGSLCVVDADDSLLDASDPSSMIFTEISGIPNDGGDP